MTEDQAKNIQIGDQLMYCRGDQQQQLCILKEKKLATISGLDGKITERWLFICENKVGRIIRADISNWRVVQ